MSNLVIQSRCFGKISPSTLDSEFAVSKDRKERTRFKGWIQAVRGGQLCRAIWQGVQSNGVARCAIRLGRRCESKFRTNYKHGRVPDAAQDRNRIGRPSFGFL